MYRGRAQRRGLLSCAVLVLTGCGPRNADDADTSSGAPQTSAPALLDLGAEVSTSGTSSTSSTCLDSTGPSPAPLDECDIPATGATSVQIEGISPTRGDAAMPCTVDEVTRTFDSELVLELSCASPERGLVSPIIRIAGEDALPLPISAGEDVLLGFAGGGLFDDVFLTLRRPDTKLVLAWISATWLPTAAEPSNPSASFLDPLAFAFDRESCGYVCDPPSEGCFIDDPCPCTHRLALDVRVEDEGRRIVDGDVATFGNGVSVHVVHASIVAARDGGPCDVTDIFPWLQVLAIVRDAD